LSSLDTHEISKYFPPEALDRVLKFHEQIQHAQIISKAIPFDFGPAPVANICATGMGGSGISGDLVRAYLAGSLNVPFVVNRDYTLPHFVDERTLVLVSSYSGDTEETISAYEDACRRNARVVCITSGGRLAELARANGHPLVLIPKGFAPRYALGYLAVPLLYCLYRAGIITNPEPDLNETIDLLQTLYNEYRPASPNSLAKRISRALAGKLPLIYASTNAFEPVAVRWKSQLSENSKVLAFCNVFPELNHNEIMGWGPLREINQNVQIIFLKDSPIHSKIEKRMQLTRDILEKHASAVLQVESRGRSLLARQFSLVYLGDVVSLYLAALYSVDPTAIENINYIKQHLAE
jgi:glucose/mannose-6-phosphate isomerase